MIILGTNSIKDTGYDVANSCRFNDGSSDGLRLSSLGTATNNKKQTLSFWCKRSTIGSVQRLFVTNGLSDPYFQIFFQSNDKLRWQTYEGSVGSVSNFITTRVFRDNLSWYHFHLVYDTTQSTSTDRTSLYINGVKETAYDTEVYPSLNSTTEFDNTTLYIGEWGGGDSFFDGYLAEFVVLDGQSITPDGNTGEFDSDSGIWKPVDVSGLTFGTNGFYLDFEDSSALGNDVSGNNNDFTANNLTAIDQSTDTCTNNWAVLNSLPKSGVTFAEGNLQADNQSSDWTSALATFGSSTGKYYAEFKVTDDAAGTTRNMFGICDARDVQTMSEDELGQNPSNRQGDTVGYSGNGTGNCLKNGSDQGSGFNTTYGVNDIISVALDCDNSAVYIAKNGSWLNSGNPESGASKTGAVTITAGEIYLIGGTVYNSTYQANFGNPIHSISSGNADGDGYGNFEYAVPSGYYALNTKNLAQYG